MFKTQLSSTCFDAYGHLQVDELTKNTHKQLHLACVFYTWGVIGWGYEISCVLCREGGVCGCVLC